MPPARPAAAPSVPRRMTLDVRRVQSDASGRRWHWFVYEPPGEDFIRNGCVVGSRPEAERTARAAVALMGGAVVGASGDGTGGDPDVAPG